jgi:hypothetical protein
MSATACDAIVTGDRKGREEEEKRRGRREESKKKKVLISV